jgi:hypothetical protein
MTWGYCRGLLRGGALEGWAGTVLSAIRRNSRKDARWRTAIDVKNGVYHSSFFQLMKTRNFLILS